MLGQIFVLKCLAYQIGIISIINYSDYFLPKSHIGVMLNWGCFSCESTSRSQKIPEYLTPKYLKLNMILELNYTRDLVSRVIISLVDCNTEVGIND